MIKELVKKSRSCRSFIAGCEVMKDDIIDLIDTARFCPSAINRQPLKYYIVSGKEDSSRVTSLVRMGGLLKDIKLPPEGKGPAAYIIMCSDNNVNYVPAFCAVDVGIAAQTIMLAASEKGLAGCMIAAFDPEKVKQAFSLAENFTPELILSLGYPEEKFRLCDVENGNTDYFRDISGIHNVPKRKLEDIIINL